MPREISLLPICLMRTSIAFNSLQRDVTKTDEKQKRELDFSVAVRQRVHAYSNGISSFT